MSSTKCTHCYLVNLPSDKVCKRCGSTLAGYKPSGRGGPREDAKRSSFLWTLLFIALIGGGAYYVFNGFERSFEGVSASEANRTAAPKPNTQLTRSESDAQRTTAYKTALQNSPELQASQKRLDEANKLMQSAPSR